jgi:hypothetical protein
MKQFGVTSAVQGGGKRRVVTKQGSFVFDQDQCAAN